MYFEVTYNGRIHHSASSFSGPDNVVGHGFFPFLSGKQVKLNFNVGHEAFRHNRQQIQGAITSSVRPSITCDQMEGSSIFQV